MKRPPRRADPVENLLEQLALDDAPGPALKLDDERALALVRQARERCAPTARGRLLRFPKLPLIGIGVIVATSAAAAALGGIPRLIALVSDAAAPAEVREATRASTGRQRGEPGRKSPGAAAAQAASADSHGAEPSVEASARVSSGSTMPGPAAGAPLLDVPSPGVGLLEAPSRGLDSAAPSERTASGDGVAVPDHLTAAKELEAMHAARALGLARTPRPASPPNDRSERAAGDGVERDRVERDRVERDRVERDRVERDRVGRAEGAAGAELGSAGEPVVPRLADAANGERGAPDSRAATTRGSAQAPAPAASDRERRADPAVGPELALDPVVAPDSAPAADLLGIANRARAERRFVAALSAYRRVIARFPDTRQAQIARVSAGDLELERGDARAAEVLFYGAVRDFDVGAEALFGLAEAYRAEARVVEERRALVLFGQRHPTNPLAPAARRRLSELDEAHAPK